MSTTYIVSDNGKLQKKGDTLHFCAADGTATTLFPYKLEQLVVLGNVEMTGGALKLLMHHHIDTVFMSVNGRFSGKITFQAGKNVFLRQKQFRLLDDQEFRLGFARSVVRGKLHNQLSFMQRISRKRDPDTALDHSIRDMKRMIDSAETAPSVDVLRGYEGTGARLFFSVFRKNIVPDWAVFAGRTMHPPQDNVNAVLSFLYTLLYYRIDAALVSEGLDSSVGYFHALEYGKLALVFDLIEEFRTPIADTLCCALFNLGVLAENDFETVTFSSSDSEFPLEPETEDENGSEGPVVFQEKQGVLLNRQGLRKVIAQFEKKLDTQVMYQPLQRQLSYKKILFEQVRHFKRLLTGEERQYKPLVLK